MDQELAAIASQAAYDAGQRARVIRAAGLDARRKPDRSLVTAADEAAEALIAERLAATGIPMIGEETLDRSDPSAIAATLAGDAWVVDPIDGTSNFAVGHPAWAVSIALLREGMPEWGVIVTPDINEDGWRGGPDGLEHRRGDGAWAAVPPLPGELNAELRPRFLMTFEMFFARGLTLERPMLPRMSGSMVVNCLRTVLGQATATLTSAFVWDFAAPMAFGRARGVELYRLDGGEALTRVDTSLRFDDPRRLCLLDGYHVFARAEDLAATREALGR